MNPSVRALRRRVLTPNTAQTLVSTRGFHPGRPTERHMIETVGSSFLTGYGHAVETASPVRVGPLLEEVPERYRGFAYEGAAMGLTVLDALTRRGARLRDFLAGAGAPHVYMGYVGAGWAMARLPRPLWPEPRAFDPVLRWLVLDGYGFHQAYFRTGRFVARHRVDPRPARWSGDPGYASRAADQGIGRALWFVACADAGRAADLVESYPADRRGDLYGGVGLAATYAGGGAEGLASLRERAGEHRRWLAQGSAFAAEARVRAGLVVPHVGVATAALCGRTPEEAAALARLTRTREEDAEAGAPAYETWRARLAERLTR
ncbi:DUF1702 family protein [Nocardiopsis sp. NPDC006938]|uniref:DUF1702 family protein n=1 Tax=Nocardiopsis sp. NPDC006938 TaxID=3364337 RepID=UPI0036A85708